MFASAEQMKQKSEGSSRLVRSSMLSIDVVRQKHGLHLLGLVVAVQELSQAPGHEGNELADLVRGDTTKAFADSQQFEQPRDSRGSYLGRRLQEKWLQVTRKPFQLIINAKKCPGIALRIFLDFLGGALSVRPPSNDLPIMKGNLQVGI